MIEKLQIYYTVTGKLISTECTQFYVSYYVHTISFDGHFIYNILKQATLIKLLFFF